MCVDLNEALQQVRQLSASLRRIADKDQEQEVLGMAVPVVDVAIREARQHLPEGERLLEAVHEVMSPENIVAGEPVRVLEVLLVVEQLESRLTTIQQGRGEAGPFIG
jgi:hypothetical protein